MSVSAPAAATANGLTTVFNILTAPRDAFSSLRERPMWGWAFLVGTVLTAAGQYLAIPATIHVMQAGWAARVAADPRLATATPEQQQAALNMAVAIGHFSWVFAPITVLVVAFVSAIIMLVFKAAGRGDAGFKQLWCAAMNVAVVGIGVYSLVAGLLVEVRGIAAFNAAADVYRAVPGLAWLVPNTSAKVTAFLSAFNAVGIWNAVLIAMAMIYVARASKPAGAICAAALLVINGAFLSIGAR